ncbi:hypothetical protein BDV93DRAFT_544250 [Ceratobasidium sp. AG-I]|nr:hypothetical protein BDV93DRAFT_544250 [Ceratobasidium sp. AG-I]
MFNSSALASTNLSLIEYNNTLLETSHRTDIASAEPFKLTRHLAPTTEQSATGVDLSPGIARTTMRPTSWSLSECKGRDHFELVGPSPTSISEFKADAKALDHTSLAAVSQAPYSLLSARRKRAISTRPTIGRPAWERLAVQYVEARPFESDGEPKASQTPRDTTRHAAQTCANSAGEADGSPSLDGPFHFLVAKRTRSRYLKNMSTFQRAVHNSLSHALAVRVMHRIEPITPASPAPTRRHKRRTQSTLVSSLGDFRTSHRKRPTVKPLDIALVRSINSSSISPPDSPEPTTPEDEDNLFTVDQIKEKGTVKTIGSILASAEFTVAQSMHRKPSRGRPMKRLVEVFLGYGI